MIRAFTKRSARIVGSSLSAKEAGTILITGCSTGIGRALALAYAERGYRVLATARALDAIRDLASDRIEIAELDVTDPGSIVRLDLASRDVGTLVNNAGYGLVGPVIDLALDDVRKQFDTNVLAVIAMTQAAAVSMIARGSGRIVNISSVSGVLATPLAGAYCASKAAVNAFSDAMRMELAPFGIAVVTVQPGAIQSAFGSTATASIAPSGRVTGFYAPIADVVRQRAMSGQIGAMPAATFARIVVERLVRRKAPLLVRAGPHSRRLPFMRRWIPIAILDRQLSRRFGLHRLGR